MSTDLATANNGVDVAPLTNATSPMKVAEAMFKSGYFKDVRSMAQSYVKILAGEELGLTPFASMTGLTIIEGRLGFAANLIATLIQEHPDYDYKVKESTNEKCVIEFVRLKEGEEVSLGESVFLVEDAERAGLVRPKSNWEKWPKAMCFNRALTQGARMFCPVVTKGRPAYTPEELGAEVNEFGEPVNVPVPEPNEAAFDGEVADAEVELDPEKFERLSHAFKTVAPELQEVQMMLGACGVDSVDSIDGLDDRLRFLTDDQFDQLETELGLYADRVAESDADAEADGE